MTEISNNQPKTKINGKTYIKSTALNLSIPILAEVIGLIPIITLKIINQIGSIYSVDIQPLTQTIVIVIISTAFSILSLIFYSSAKQGQKAWYSGNLTGHKNSLKRFIFWIKPKYSLKSFFMNITITVLKLTWFLIFCSPSFLLLITVIALAFTGGIEFYLFIPLAAGCILLFLLGTTFTFIITQRYFLTGYLLTENPKKGIIRSIISSKNLMEGQISQVIKMKLKFLPTIFTFPLIIPMIFILPHYKQCCCILANKLRL